MGLPLCPTTRSQISARGVPLGTFVEEGRDGRWELCLSSAANSHGQSNQGRMQWLWTVTLPFLDRCSYTPLTPTLCLCRPLHTPWWPLPMLRPPAVAPPLTPAPLPACSVPMLHTPAVAPSLNPQPACQVLMLHTPPVAASPTPHPSACTSGADAEH